MLKINIDCDFSISAACHSSCTGLNKCTGVLENDCCNYLNKNQCVTQCGTNMFASRSTGYSCVCSGLYTGADCIGELLCGDHQTIATVLIYHCSVNVSRVSNIIRS